MRPLRYCLKCFSLFLIFFVVNIKLESAQEFHFTKPVNTYLKKVCDALGTPFPKTENECRKLREVLKMRYGEIFMGNIESKVKVSNGATRGEDYWKSYFWTLTIEADDVESLLIESNMMRIPVWKEEWEMVKQFFIPLINNIFEYGLEYKIRILISGNNLYNETDFLNAFIKLSRLYPRVPKNILAAIKDYFRYSQELNGATALDALEKIAKEYMKMREIAAIADVVSQARFFMEESESRVYLLTLYFPEDCRDIVVKLLLLEKYYGVELDKLEEPHLRTLSRSSIEYFLNYYQPTTKFKFMWESSNFSSITTPVSSKSAMDPITHTYIKLMKKAETDNVDISPPTNHPDMLKLTSHYVKCRMMLLTEKPSFFAVIKTFLKGKTHSNICMTWDSLYTRLNSFIPEPNYRLGIMFSKSEKIEAIKHLELDPDIMNLLIAIVETESMGNVVIYS